MNIEFINENTVKITASLKWEPLRPPPELKTTQRKEEFIAEFKKKHPSYIIEEVVGPDKIANFRTVEKSKGTWILKVSKKKKEKSTPPIPKKEPTIVRATRKPRKKAPKTSKKQGA